MRMTPLGALALAAALSLGAAACGGDDGDEDASATTTEAPADGGDDAGDDGDATDDTTGLDDLDLSGDCEFLLGAATAFSSAFSGENADFDDIAEGFEELTNGAPDELQDDVEVLAQAYREFADAIGDVDFNDPEAFSDPEVQQRFAEAGAIFESDEVVEANESFSNFAEENCSAEG